MSSISSDDELCIYIHSRTFWADMKSINTLNTSLGVAIENTSFIPIWGLHVLPFLQKWVSSGGEIHIFLLGITN